MTIYRHPVLSKRQCRNLSVSHFRSYRKKTLRLFARKRLNFLEKQYMLIFNIVWATGAIILMLAYSPVLTLVALGLFILPIVASMMTGTRLEKAEKTVSEKNAGFVATLKDILSGFSVIKSFKAENAAIDLLEQSSEILHNIDIDFEAGRSYAIVGSSGSGKSTLLNLLMAARHDYTGTICFDKAELREISSKALLRRFHCRVYPHLSHNTERTIYAVKMEHLRL